MSDTALSLREQYRRKLVGDAMPFKSKRVEFFGLPMELRQPILADIIGAQSFADETMPPAEVTRRTIARHLTMMAYIPDTDIRIFEEGDYEQIMKWPFGNEYMQIQDAINELTGIDVAKEEKAFNDAPLA